MTTTIMEKVPNQPPASQTVPWMLSSFVSNIKVSNTKTKMYNQQQPAAFARTHLESLSSLDIDSVPAAYPNTAIACSIGPSSMSEQVLLQMMKAGMSIAILNFAYNSHEYYEQVIKNIRQAATRYGKPVAIAFDTKGPEIRTGFMKGGLNKEAVLVRGDPVTVTTNDYFKDACDAETIYIDYKKLVKSMSVGNTIYIDEGNISLIVKDKRDDHLLCSVECGGILGDYRRVNLPNTIINLPAISAQDAEDIQFGIEQGIDFVFASFVDTGNMTNVYKEIRDLLGTKGKRIRIIAKIDTYDGVKHINDILMAADGVMIARGDLGTEISPEKVFIAQKMIISRCNRVSKPVLCAAQMLDSMMKKSQPTRAEASDVANAVLDGADCVMLSRETSKGHFPALCVEIMSKICREAEAAVYHSQLFEELRILTPRPVDVTRCTAISAVEASIECMAAAIICITTTGRSSFCISSYRPRCPVFAVTRDAQTARQMRIYRGIIPIIYKEPKAGAWDKDLENRLAYGLNHIVDMEYIKEDDFIVFVYTSHSGPGNSNTVRITKYNSADSRVTPSDAG